jgi:2-oxoglutarate dehydrogenase E2 component (dihydrolipoamide succinyltransferase)
MGYPWPVRVGGDHGLDWGGWQGGQMSIEIIVPEMGESVFEATITSWKKTAGEQVSAGEAVVELETDKVNLEVGAPQSGVIERIEKQEGETVVVGEVIAFLTPGENQASAHVVAPAPESAQLPDTLPRRRPLKPRRWPSDWLRKTRLTFRR